MDGFVLHLHIPSHIKTLMVAMTDATLLKNTLQFFNVLPMKHKLTQQSHFDVDPQIEMQTFCEKRIIFYAEERN